MKKAYTKPAIEKRGQLSKVTAIVTRVSLVYKEDEFEALE